jgi:CheY-like chemotaxis protein
MDYTTSLHESDIVGGVMQKTVLCIENDPSILMIYRAILADCGYNVLVALDGRFGLDLLDHHKVDVAVIDYEMPEMDGGRVAMELSIRKADVPVVLISGYNEIPAEVMVHVHAFVEKPFTTEQLLHSIETALTIKGQQMLSARSGGAGPLLDNLIVTVQA